MADKADKGEIKPEKEHGHSADKEKTIKSVISVIEKQFGQLIDVKNTA